MENSTVKQHQGDVLWFEVFIDYDKAEFAYLVDYLKEHHNVRSGIKDNGERCIRAIDALHRNRFSRSDIYKSAKALDPRVAVRRTREDDVFYLSFSDGDAAMIFKLTYC